MNSLQRSSDRTEDLLAQLGNSLTLWLETAESVRWTLSLTVISQVLRISKETEKEQTSARHGKELEMASIKKGTAAYGGTRKVGRPKKVSMSFF